MVKDITIEKLVAVVFKSFDREELFVVDHWEADLLAVGFVRRGEPSRLLYVTSFDEPPGEYAVIQERDVDGVQSNGEPAKHVPVDGVIKMITEYLGVIPTVVLHTLPRGSQRTR